MVEVSLSVSSHRKRFVEQIAVGIARHVGPVGIELEQAILMVVDVVVGIPQMGSRSKVTKRIVFVGDRVFFHPVDRLETVAVVVAVFDGQAGPDSGFLDEVTVGIVAIARSVDFRGSFN